tara:strand:+ start:1713 stop:2429 length:717 start_codon:yes stop_codon:yes gene_type:complete
MVAEYVIDQKDFHRRILRMATVIVDNDYAIREKEAVWSDDYYKDHLEGSSIYKNRVHWVRAELESELLRRANNALLPVDLAVVPNLFTCKAIALLFILSGTYKAMLSRDKRHLKSRQFIHNNVQSFSSKTIERTLKDAVAEGAIVEISPDTKGRIKLLYTTSTAYRKQWAIACVATAAVRTAWALIDLANDNSPLPAIRLKFWEDNLGHDRAIIDYAVSQIMVMKSSFSNDFIVEQSI